MLALAFSSFNPWVDVVSSLAGTFVAAGAVAVLGATFWWFRDIVTAGPDSDNTLSEEDDEPVAMGFGDVKLAAVLGAILGWQNLLVALLLAFIIGAVGGVIGRVAGGGRVIPFGPPLALGGLLALFAGTGDYCLVFGDAGCGGLGNSKIKNSSHAAYVENAC